jgi:hypothetical protein
MKTAEQVTLGKAFSTLLEELARECREALRLHAQLQLTGLSAEQTDTILWELASTAVYLHSHSYGLQDIMMKMKEGQEGLSRFWLCGARERA